MHFLDHTADNSVILFNYSVVHFFEPEGVEGPLLNCRAVDAALYLFDYYLCH